MRCKNCGSENEEGRYICQNCGSPLYDENDEFMENGGYYDEYEDDEEFEKKATKKSIIIIVILSVILVAIITGVVFAVSSFGGGKTPESSESDNIGVSDDYSLPSSSSSFNSTSETTTESTTESTTEKTTESTTKPTTTTTTKPSSTKPTESKYKIYIDVDGNGSILGEGEYSKGKRVTLVATPDAGAQFVGWYENGVIVASGTKYSFTVDNERHLTALFQTIPEEAGDNEPAGNE
ncbi:MAG: hypothetical protein K2F65_01105 [Eubacterium sp.]|nr:hypothetical protein [Eubacterium sp.]